MMLRAEIPLNSGLVTESAMAFDIVRGAKIMIIKRKRERDLQQKKRAGTFFIYLYLT